MSEYIGTKIGEQYNALMSIIGGEIIDEGKIESIVSKKVGDTFKLRAKGLNFSIEANQKQIRIINGRINTIIDLPPGATTNDARLEDIRVDYNGVTHSTPGDAVRSLGALIEELKTQAIATKPQLTASDNLNNVTEPGIYYIFSGDQPSNMPEPISGALMVFDSLGGAFTQGTVQVLYGSTSTWTRYSNSDGFQKWRKTVNVADIPSVVPALIKQKNLTASNHVDDIFEMGAYYIYSGDSPRGLPSQVSGMFVVFNSSSKSAPMGTGQLFITSSGSYIRYRNSTVFSPWQNITGGGGSTGGGTIINAPIGGYDYIVTKDGMTKIMKPWTVLSQLVDTRTNKVYNKGDSVPTMPYNSTFSKGRDILYNANLTAFYSMASNPMSDIYMSDDYGHYGSVCSTLSGYLSGQDIYYTTTELWQVLDFYEFNGANLRIGDNMLKEGHSKIITDILVDSNGKITSVGVGETGGPIAFYNMHSIDDFKRQLVQNGGEYLLGRFANYKSQEIEEVVFPTDCSPNKGHKSIYKMNEPVKVWVKGGAVTTIYVKKDTGSYQTVSLASLTKQTVGENSQYDLSTIINSPGVWYVTTNAANKPNELLKCEVGSININGDKFTVSGYSEGLKPLWYQIVRLKTDGESQPYPAPTGYKSILDYHNKHMLNGDTASFTVLEPLQGYYVRVMYKTAYGQTWVDSGYVLN